MRPAGCAVDRPLTAAECRVLERLEDEAALFKEIGPDLGISENTAKSLALNAYRKLGVRNRWRAVDRHRRLRDHVCQHLRYVTA